MSRGNLVALRHHDWLFCTHPGCTEFAVACVLASDGLYYGDASCGDERHAAYLVGDADLLATGDGDSLDDLRSFGAVR